MGLNRRWCHCAVSPCRQAFCYEMFLFVDDEIKGSASCANQSMSIAVLFRDRVSEEMLRRNVRFTPSPHPEGCQGWK